MGRMKELCIQIMSANDGVIPREMTISDVRRMDELQIFEWEEYEREQAKIRLQYLESENTRKASEVEQAAKEYLSRNRETSEEKESE
jgi:hypothetical protein